MRHGATASSARRAGVFPAIAVLFVLGAPAGFAASTGELAALRNGALEFVNEARRENGLQPLELGTKVNEAALSHATDMLQRDYYSHTSPEGGTVQDRYVLAGGSKWRLVAENIARCAACTAVPDIAAVERLHRGWMQSPEHRRNILRRGLTQFGFAIISNPKNGLYAVQTFAGPGVPRGNGMTAAFAPGEPTEIAVSTINNSRGKSDLPPLESSAVLIELARSVLPDADDAEFEVEQGTNLYALLPEGQRGVWQSISMMAAACGGCGSEATGADAWNFVEQWLANQKYRVQLLKRHLTHLGFAIAANGNGKKIGIAMLAER
jgi:uncharacterized protein YkwD